MPVMLRNQWASWTRQRRGRVARSLRGALPLGALLFSGCALLPDPYGEVVPDAEPVRPGGQPNFIPAYAPSIMNGHWAGEDGHEGIDVIGKVGLPVIAPADGEVVRSFFEPMYGHAVFIRHADRADGTALRTRLVHLDERLVEEGDAVVRGQQIGSLGRTGLLAGGIPHLHFEVQTRSPGRWEIFQVSNPHLYWVDGPGIVTCFDRRATYLSGEFRTTYPVPCRGVPWN